MQPLDNTEKIWKLVLESIGTEYSDTAMDLWFKPLRLTYLDDKSAIMVTPSSLFCGIIAEKFAPSIAAHFKSVIGYDVEINILSSQSTDDGDEDSSLPSAELPGFSQESVYVPDTGLRLQDSTQSTVSAAADIVAADRDELPENRLTRIGAEYTFDNFIVGSSNKFAHAACINVASDLAGQYNPLFIYGQSGLGKTHLMYAITNELYAKNPAINLIYIKGEEFTNQLIDAIARGTTVAFREKYRKADVLLIDDIQFIAGKESTQEEFFHTFNALHEDHRQIILTSDRPPKDIQTLEDRIRSRFESGLLADIQPPDFELRLAILKNKAESMNLSVPNEVLNFLAEKLHSNIRQIEGVIKKLGAMSFLTGSPINLKLVCSSIPEFIKENEPTETTVDRILSTVAKKYGVTSTDILSKKRTQDIAFARHVAIYITRAVTELSLPAIGKVFSRDHTTVMSSCNVIENEMISNSKFHTDINEMIREIKE